jgi:ABC-2 type transport system permease protein
MGMLIKAEFRKILTTKLWWALLVPAVLLAVAWTWLAGLIFTDFANNLNDFTRDVGVNVNQLSWASPALTRGMNFATIFPMVFGALALATEISRKTITTTFLTAPNRVSVLGAKAIVYVLWGLIYGVVVAGAASLGLVIGADKNLLPNAGDWILILITGVLACVLWTLLGMGVGALLGSQVATLVLLLVYAALVGPVAEFFLTTSTNGSHVAGFMPNGSANGLTGSTATQLLLGQVQDLVASQGRGLISQHDVDIFNSIVRALAGAPGAFSLWVSGAIFLAWTAVFFAAGIWRNQRRDIT